MAFDINNATHRTALTTELATDPRGYGYATALAIGNDTELARLLNLDRDGSIGTVPTNPTADGGQASGIILVPRTSCSTLEVIEAIDGRDLANMNAAAAALFESILQNPSERVILTNADGSPSRSRQNLDRIITNTNGSQTRFDALKTEVGNRLEEKFGVGSSIRGDDIPRVRPQ